jgi:type I restriction enzyme S subunit
MDAERLLEHYERIADAPDAIGRLRRFILDLAMRGKLVPQDPKDEPASEMLKRIAKEKARLVKAGDLRKSRDLDDDGLLKEPFAIPATWRWARLDAVGAIVGGGTPYAADADNFAEPGAGVPWPTPADLGGYSDLYISRGARDLSEKGSRTSSATLMLAGTVLFTSRAPIGYVAVAANPISTNQGFKSIVPYVADCSPFIATAMQAFAPELDAKAPGTTFKEVSGKIVAAIAFPLPPLAEQHRIVAKVDELMALCDRLETAQAGSEATRDRLAAASLARLNAPDPATFQDDACFALDTLQALTTRPDQIKQLRQTILNLAVRGKLVPQDPNGKAVRLPALRQFAAASGMDDEVFEQFRDSIVLPNGWQIAPLARLSEHIVDCPHITLKWTDRGEICVRANQLRPRSLALSEPRFVSPETYLERIEHLEPRADDILYSREGGILGIACRVPNGVRLCLGQRLMLIRAGAGTGADFLEMVLNSPFITDIAKARTTGGAAPRVNMSTVRAYPIPLPPLAEQHRIVAKVDALMALCDRLEASLAAGAATRRRLLDALLAEALTPINQRDAA